MDFPTYNYYLTNRKLLGSDTDLQSAQKAFVAKHKEAILELNSEADIGKIGTKTVQVWDSKTLQEKTTAYRHYKEPPKWQNYLYIISAVAFLIIVAVGTVLSSETLLIAALIGIAPVIAFKVIKAITAHVKLKSLTTQFCLQTVVSAQLSVFRGPAPEPETIPLLSDEDLHKMARETFPGQEKTIESTFKTAKYWYAQQRDIARVTNEQFLKSTLDVRKQLVVDIYTGKKSEQSTRLEEVIGEIVSWIAEVREETDRINEQNRQTVAEALRTAASVRDGTWQQDPMLVQMAKAHFNKLVAGVPPANQ